MKDDKNFMNGTFEVSYIYTKVYETTNFHATILFLDFIIQNNGLLNTIFYYSNGEPHTALLFITFSIQFVHTNVQFVEDPDFVEVHFIEIQYMIFFM